MKPNINCIVLHRIVEGETKQFIDISKKNFFHILKEAKSPLVSIDEGFKKNRGSENLICLTFDDGFSSDSEIVLPELIKNNSKATFFIVTDWIGKPGYMDVKQIKNLSKAGMQIGSHSVSHPNFLELNGEERISEFRRSKIILEDFIDRDVTSFSFPFGYYDKECLEMAFKSGYSICCTSDHGISRRRQTVVFRNSINSNTSIKRINKILKASIQQRLYWVLEDLSKRLIKKYFPNIYLRIRNIVSKL